MLFKVELEVPMLDAKCPTLSSIASFFFFNSQNFVPNIKTMQRDYF